MKIGDKNNADYRHKKSIPLLAECFAEKKIII